MSVRNFDHTTESLIDLLQSVKKGKTQLPDFQRAWVWSDDQICSILASISLSYPVGVVMMLQTGNVMVRFQERLIEGVTLKDFIKPERLILDGQQRITSLFQALLLNQPAKTKDIRGKVIYRWYYIDIEKALNPNFDRESAFISLPENKIIGNFRKEVVADYSTVEKEYQNSLFPVTQIFSYSDWMFNYYKFWDSHREKAFKLFEEFNREVIKPFEQYQIPVISLHQETPREAVCQVFEKVNTGGVSLTVFELLTATFAVDKFQLRDDWETRKQRLQQLPVLLGIASTDFLQAVTLLATRDRRNKQIFDGYEIHKAPAISCTRKDILKLTLTEYKDWADKVTEGFEKAAKLLHTQKIFTAIDLPYQPQLTVLAAIFAVLEENSDLVRAKLVRWYWCGVFGEIYSGAIESQIAKDLPQVLQWIQADDDSEPDTITDANFSPNRLLGLKTRRSAAYKGLSALLLRDKGCDFLTGYEIDTLMNFGDAIDIHHIFPRKWCEENGIEAKVFDSIINKAPLSSRTNKIIGSKAPSIYLSKLQEKAKITEERMDDILQSHAINPGTLRSDNFQAFFDLRQEALLNRIETAMGKTILRSESMELA